MFLQKSSFKRFVKSAPMAGLVIALIALNVIGLRSFARLDFTHDQQFTLSQASQKMLRGLKEKVTIRAYFTENLPPPYAANARYVRDLLDEYYAQSHGQLRYEFIDPEAAETSADKDTKKDVKHNIFGQAVREQTTVEKKLEELGIPSVQVRVNEGDKLEVKRAYMGIAIEVGDKKEVVPVVQDTEGLEYGLTTILYKMTREVVPKVAIVAGHDSTQNHFTQLQSMMQQLYQFQSVDLNAADMPADVQALLVLGPSTPLSEQEQRRIDAFVQSGHSAAFFVDTVKPDLQTLSSTPAVHGLDALLESYGVRIQPGLMVDAQCATIGVKQQQGNMPFNQPMQYPLMPTPENFDVSHPLTRGMSTAVFPFVSPLELTANASSELTRTVLVRSSPKSWVMPAPYDLNPMQEWSTEKWGKPQSQALMVSLSGHLKSPFGAQPSTTTQPSARVLVAAGSSFLDDAFLNRNNQVLALNILDWMVMDEDILTMRVRGMSQAPLADISTAHRNTLKYANIVGLPFMFSMFGVFRWRKREQRRKTAQF